MVLYPAIDLIGGQAVRLTQGEYDRVTVYESDPVKVACQFENQGAQYLHLVDLDGARDGTLSNLDTLRRILSATSLKAEVGGGIRDEARIATYLEAGASRVILGSVALKDPAFVGEMVKKYGAPRIVVGVDAKDGRVAVHGWKTVSQTSSLDFCSAMADLGVTQIVYTDIACDGALSGTNLEIYRTLRTALPQVDFTASGGITYYEELKVLSEMGLYGAILGKALYTGALDLEKALKITKEASPC